MYCRPSVRWLTSARCSSRTSIVATVVSASRRPVSARWTSVTDASSRDHSTCMTASCDAVRRGAAAFRGLPEYYTRRRRTVSQGGSQFDGQARVNTDGSVDVYFGPDEPHGPASKLGEYGQPKDFSCGRPYSPTEAFFSRMLLRQGCAEVHRRGFED